MRIVCEQTVLMKYHTLFFLKLGKMSQNLSSAADMIGGLRVKPLFEVCGAGSNKDSNIFDDPPCSELGTPT